MADSFFDSHPIVNFYYFIFVITVTMFFLNPFILGVSLISSAILLIFLSGLKGLKFNIFFMLPLLIITALINPLFNHEGVTILFYLKNSNPITLESIVYGLISAAMLICTILWFACYNKVICSDKLMFLLGRIAPKLALAFSMILRFIPTFKTNAKEIINAQKCLDNDIKKSSIKTAINILFALLSLSLENSIITANSMKARGYGLKGRTSYSNYRFLNRDLKLFCCMLVLSLTTLSGLFSGAGYVRYFPSFKASDLNFIFLLTISSYLIFCFLPIIIGVWEIYLRWKYSK